MATGSFLDLMGATAGAIALIDRLAENPKMRKIITRYADKTDAQLRYIIKDAGEAARAMKEVNPQAEAKYLDQMNDAATELYQRRKGNPEERTSATSKRAEALRYFESLLRSGVDWADAQWKASQRFGVSAARIAADYDFRFKNRGATRSANRLAENPKMRASNPVVIRDSAGRPVKRSENLRGILDYTNQRGVWVERLDLFGPNKQGGGTLGVTWNTGATTLADFADFSVMEDWVKQRAKGKRALWGTEAIKYAAPVASNPRGRSKRGVTRPSQITKKPPTKRLLARRKKTARAPAGFFANPADAFCYFGVKVSAGNDRNGNPRRAVAFFRHNGSNATLLAVADEGYSGLTGAIQSAGLDPAKTPVIGTFDVPVSEYRNLLKMKPGIAY